MGAQSNPAAAIGLYRGMLGVFVDEMQRRTLGMCFASNKVLPVFTHLMSAYNDLHACTLTAKLIPTLRNTLP